jgi:CRISPR/Cas system endoribonuclease Cas6 (RAMP superfamily)
LSSPILIYLQISSEKKNIKKKFGGGLKHAVNQVTTQKKATMKKVDSQNLFCKTNLQKKKNMVPMYLAPLSPQNKKNTRNYCSPCRKKIYSKMKIALKRTYEKNM